MSPRSVAVLAVLAGVFLGSTGLSVRADPGGSPGFELSGKLFFGEIETRFTEVGNDPREGQAPNPDFPDDGFQSVLQVLNQSGRLPGVDGLTFGDGSALPVHVFANGDALFLGPGAVVLEGSVNGSHRVGGVRLRYARLQLSTQGLAALDAAAMFPAGSGFAADGTTRLLEGQLPLGVIPLNETLRPKAEELGLAAADVGLASLWFHHEQLPVRLETDRIAWKVSDGAFEILDGRWEFVRGAEMAFLEARAAVLSQNQILRWSNDHGFRDARGLGGNPVRLTVDAKGRGHLDATVEMRGTTDWIAHFPAGVRIPMRDALMVVSDGNINTTASRMDLVPNEAIPMAYRQGCPDGGCAGDALALVDLSSPDGTMTWTPDGGFQGEVDVRGPGPGPFSLAWGALGGDRFAHSVDGWAAGRLGVSGFVLKGEVVAGLRQRGDAPGALLLSGARPPKVEAAPVMERPQDPEYAEGQGDYAGLNLRLGADGEGQAVSHLAGQRVPAVGTYAMRAGTKYYLRPAGVSGRHQAVTESFPRDLRLYGFRTSLDGLRLSYLDNAVLESATDGGLAVPYPSDFIQEFASLRLRCNGQLLDAEVRGESRHTLAYWLAPFRANTLEFRGALNAPCDTTEGVLLVGASVALPLVRDPALGILGFRSDGRLVSALDAISGVDSRLALPARVKLTGSEGRDYTLMPVTKAWFNAWPGAGGEPANGFVTFAGKLDLPWFLDAKVQVHAVGGGAIPFLELMGGWNNNGKPDVPSQAWVEGADHTFFNWQDFDPGNRGYPGGVALETYRDSGDERFRPRAQQRLFGMAKAELDLPMAWKSAARSFESAGLQRRNLLIFELEAEAARVTAGQAQLRFGAGVQDGAPRFSASQFLLGEIEGRTGLFSTVSNAVSRLLNDNGAARSLRSGADALDEVLSPDLGKLLGNELLAALDRPADALLDAVLARAQGGAATAGDFHAALCDELGQAGNAIALFQQGFLETTEFIEVLGRKLENSLRTADDAVTSAIAIVEPKEVEPAKFRRTVVSEVAKRLVREAPPDAPPLLLALAGHVAPQLLDEVMDAYVAEALEPSLSGIESSLRDVHRELGTLVDELSRGRGVLRSGFESAQDALQKAGTFYRDATNAVCVDLKQELRPVLEAIRDRARLKERIKRVMLAELLKGALPKETHLFLRQYLLSSRGLFRGALEDLFEQVNAAIVGVALGPLRDLVEDQVGELDKGVIRAVGQIQDVLEGSRLHGQADILDEGLRRLRVDGEFRFKLGPSEMGSDRSLALDAWYAVENYQGDSPGRGCRPAGGTFQEVSFGASTSPGGGFAQGLKVGVTGRFSLNPSGDLLGLAGGITATGSKRIGAFSARDPQLGFSFGQEGNYLGGSVSGRFKDITVDARMFVGMGCHLGDLKLVDSDVLSVLAKYGVEPSDPVVGFYYGGDMALPLERFLPIPLPSTCLLSLEARGGIGYFGFLKPSAPQAFLVGMRQRFGLKGRLLCVLSGEGDLNLAAAVGFNTLGTAQGTMAGTLKVAGEAGFCPVCAQVSKTFPWVIALTADDAVFRSPF